MNSSSQIPRDFYYEELTKYLLSITNSAHKMVSGHSLSDKAKAKIEESFIDYLKEQNISSAKCLQTMYAIRLRRNAKTKHPLTKSEVKSNMIDMLVRRFHSSTYCPEFQDELSTAISIKNDFPPLSELYSKSSQLEGKTLPFTDEPTVHSIQKGFLDLYKAEVSRSRSHLSEHPIKKIRAIKKAQKLMRYRNTEGFILKSKLALGATIVAGVIAFGLHLPDILPTSKESNAPIEQTEPVDSSQANKKIDEVIEQISADPSLLQSLGFSEDVCEDFKKYIMYSNSENLTEEQRKEFEAISSRLVSNFNKRELQNSTELDASNVQDFSINSSGLDYVSLTYSTPSEDPNKPNIHSITLSPGTNIEKSNQLQQNGDLSSAVLVALRGSLCTLEFDSETGYYEKDNETALEKITQSISNSSKEQNQNPSHIDIGDQEL